MTEFQLLCMMLKAFYQNYWTLHHNLVGDPVYKLENGTLLHSSEWNGEKYTVKTKTGEVEYIPVYADEPNENDGYDIIGFVEQ